MNIFSYGFFAIWTAAFILYYSVGSKWQWQILTITSTIFYALSIQKAPIVLLGVWVTTYLGGKIIACSKNSIGRLCFFLGLSISIGLLIFGRKTNSVALLGNSYFTLKAVGYLIDVYRDEPAEANPFRYLLYLIYWPTVFEGPFNRIKAFNNAFKEVRVFSYEKLSHGVQRFLWGAFKKLVIAERLSVLATGILADPAGKGGKYVILAVLAYAIQLYADFSGFMDMMLGLSLTFGIELPENFRQPYFSKSIPEFWRRWHITLGIWFRDYVMFPVTASSPVKKVSKNIRRKNKVWGKLFPILLGTCTVWLLTGLWHGLNWNYLLWGMYYALLMCLSQIYQSFFRNQKRSDKKWRKAITDGLAVCRTITLVLVADTMICVQGFRNVFALWKEILWNLRGGAIESVYSSGFTLQSAVIVLMGIAAVFVVSVIKETGRSPQAILDNAPLVFRWSIYYVLIFAILILGQYGSQYDTSQFLYMQF